MSSDSDDSSEDEVSDLIREAADCAYINKLYNGISVKEDKPSKRKAENCENESTLTSHQVFIAKKLSEILDSLIKFKKIKTLPEVSELAKLPNYGIRLLSDSVIIDEVEEEEIVYKKPPPKISFSKKEHKELVKEASVSTDWILSKKSTQAWRSYNQEKVVYLKVDNKSKNKLECSVISKTF